MKKLNIKNLDEFKEVKNCSIVFDLRFENYVIGRTVLNPRKFDCGQFFLEYFSKKITKECTGYRKDSESKKMIVYYKTTNQRDHSYNIQGSRYEEDEEIPFETLENDINNIFSFCKFGVYSHENENSITYKIFGFEEKDEHLFLKLIHTLSFQYKDNELFFLIDGKVKNIDEYDEFRDYLYSSDSCYSCDNCKALLMNFGMNYLSHQKGFLDIVDKYAYMLDDLIPNNIKEVYYAIHPQYFAIFEKLAKSFPHTHVGELKDMMNLYSPYYTHKPFPPLKNVETLSKASKYLLETRNAIYETLVKAEKHELIGIDGLNIIVQYSKLFEKAFDHNYRNSYIDIEKIINIIDYIKITPKVLMDRITRNCFRFDDSVRDFLTLLDDTVRMAKVCNVSITKIDNNIKLLHDNLSAIYKEVISQEKEQLFQKQYLLNKELLKNVPESENYTILCPQKPQDLVKEGNRMHHCVGSYVHRVIDGKSKIFFVREKRKPSTEFVTVEIDKYNNLVQARAKYNHRPPEEVMEFIYQFTAAI